MRRDLRRRCPRRVSNSSRGPDKTVRNVIEVSNRSTTPGRYLVPHGGLDPVGGFHREFS